MNQDNLLSILNGIPIYSGKSFNWVILSDFPNSEKYLTLGVSMDSNGEFFCKFRNSIEELSISAKTNGIVSSLTFRCKTLEEAEKIVYAFLKRMRLYHLIKGTIYDKMKNHLNR